jgi:hypothetical protein
MTVAMVTYTVIVEQSPDVKSCDYRHKGFRGRVDYRYTLSMKYDDRHVAIMKFLTCGMTETGNYLRRDKVIGKDLQIWLIELLLNKRKVKENLSKAYYELVKKLIRQCIVAIEGNGLILISK